MAKINTINVKEVSKTVTSDFVVECREKVESMTVRLPEQLATRLKQLKKDMEIKGHKVTISDIIISALLKALGDN